jgi:hypothetical protein
MRPLTIQGRIVHQVGLPYHFGNRGLVRGDVVNDLVAISEEPNVRIMESKALVCRVAVARDQGTETRHPERSTGASNPDAAAGLRHTVAGRRFPDGRR